MLTKWIALLGLAALLSACASPPGPRPVQAWNDGTWNSVLGYHGPANAMVGGGPSR